MAGSAPVTCRNIPGCPRQRANRTTGVNEIVTSVGDLYNRNNREARQIELDRVVSCSRIDGCRALTGGQDPQIGGRNSIPPRTRRDHRAIAPDGVNGGRMDL